MNKNKIETTEAVQLAAVKEYGAAIKFIDNPSEAVQLVAVKKHGDAIKFIDNPSEAVQLVAVKKHGDAISYIKNPSEAVQLAAVKQDGSAIEHIDNPNEEDELTCRDKFDIYFKYREEDAKTKRQLEVFSTKYLLTFSTIILLLPLFITPHNFIGLENRILLSLSYIFFLKTVILSLINLYLSISNHNNQLNWLTNNYLPEIINDEDIPAQPKKTAVINEIITRISIITKLLFIVGFISLCSFLIINIL